MNSCNPIPAKLEDLKSMFHVAFCYVTYANNCDFSWIVEY